MTLDDYIDLVCLEFKIKRSELRKKSREHKYSIPRMVACKLIYLDNKYEKRKDIWRYGDFSSNEVGNELNIKGTTVRVMSKKCSDLITLYPKADYSVKYFNIKEKVELIKNAPMEKAIITDYNIVEFDMTKQTILKNNQVRFDFNDCYFLIEQDKYEPNGIRIYKSTKLTTNNDQIITKAESSNTIRLF